MYELNLKHMNSKGIPLCFLRMVMNRLFPQSLPPTLLSCLRLDCVILHTCMCDHLQLGLLYYCNVCKLSILIKDVRGHVTA